MSNTPRNAGYPGSHLPNWLPASGLELAGPPGFFERYGRTFDPETGEGGLEIFVRKKAGMQHHRGRVT
jgi:hypothetical protein